MAHNVKTQTEGGNRFMRKNKLMSKIGAVALSAAMVACSLVIMPASEVKADEATTVEPVYFNDFEEGVGDATVVGSGAVETAEDTHFGKVFHNAVDGQATRTNYLLLPEDVLAKSAETKALTVSFWVNVGTATDYFFSPIFSAYAEKATANSWPMMVLQSRLIAQVNCNGWCDFTDAENAAGACTVDTSWLDDKAWHYYTATFEGNTVKVYVDGVLKNQWTAGEGCSVEGLYSNGSELKYVCLGGNQAWDWADPDPAYMFDDVAIYNVALTEAQISAVMAEKLATPMTAISLTETASVLVGGSSTLTYTIAPEDTTDKPEVTFTSSDDKVATVDSTGKVTGVAGGTATITVTAKVGDSTFTDTCAVTVTAEANPITNITATIDKNSFDLGDGSATSATMKVELTIKDATKEATDSKTVTYTSSDEKVATVDKDGKVTVVGKGTATITASLENGLKASVDVTVVKTIKVTTEVDCSGWWVAHSSGVEVTKEGVKLTFKNTTYDSATANWNGPIYVLYTGNEPLVNGDGYVEYAVMRGDLYGWTPTCNTAETDKWTAAGHTFTANGADFDEAGWAEWLKGLKAGQNCTVTAKLVDGGVQVKMTVGKAVSTATYKVDTTKPVYISLGGELCKLTNIEAASMDTSVKVPTAVTATEVAKIAEKVTVKGAPEGAKIATSVVDTDVVTKVESFKSTTLKGLTFQAIDLKLVDGAGVDVKADGSVEVTMPVLESLKSAKQINVYVVEGDALTLVQTVDVTSDGMITFNAPHFSTYVFAAKLSGTADTAPIIPVVIVGCVAAAAVLVAKKRKVTE